MCIYQLAGLTAQVPIIKPAQKHKYNTKLYDYIKQIKIQRIWQQ